MDCLRLLGWGQEVELVGVGVLPFVEGVEFAVDPKKEPWGTTSIFKDADGNQFVLSSK